VSIIGFATAFAIGVICYITVTVLLIIGLGIADAIGVTTTVESVLLTDDKSLEFITILFAFSCCNKSSALIFYCFDASILAIIVLMSLLL